MTSAIYSPRSCHWSEARGYQGLRLWNASKDAVLPAGADAGWYYPHGSYMLREIWVELLKPGGRLSVSRRMGPEAANICVGDCDRFSRKGVYGLLANILPYVKLDLTQDQPNPGDVSTYCQRLTDQKA